MADTPDNDANETEDSLEIEGGEAIGEGFQGAPLLLPPPSSAPPPISGNLETDGGIDAWAADRELRLGRNSSLPPMQASPTTQSPPDPFSDAEEVSTVMELPEAPPDAIELVDRASPDVQTPDVQQELADSFALGDFSGAYRLANLMLGREPENQEAEWYRDQSHQKIKALLHSRFGEGKVPAVIAPVYELRWYGLDSRAVLLLSKMDGIRTVSGVIAEAGVDEIEGLRAIHELIGQGIVRMESSGVRD